MTRRWPLPGNGLLLGFVVGAGLFRIWGESTLHQWGRDVERLRRERKTLETQVVELGSELAEQRSRRNLRWMARTRLGLEFPTEGELRFVVVEREPEQRVAE